MDNRGSIGVNYIQYKLSIRTHAYFRIVREREVFKNYNKYGKEGRLLG